MNGLQVFSLTSLTTISLPDTLEVPLVKRETMLTITEIDYDQWVEQYKPIMNKHGEIRMFETYGEDMDFLQQQDYHHVWTYVDDGDYGNITNGFAFVNRLCYYMTEVAWEGEDTMYQVTWED